MKKRYNVSEFTSNSVFQEWFYVFTIQLGIRASPSATHYTSWTSSVMDEIKKPSEFSPGDWAAQSPSLLRCLQKFIVHSAGRSQGSQVKKEGNLYAGDRGHFTPDCLDTRIIGANILIVTQAGLRTSAFSITSDIMAG